MGDGRVYNYDTTNHNPSPSATSSPSPQPHDEISLFLRQILFPSSSSSPSLLNAHTSMSLPMANAHFSARSSLFQDAISALDSSASPDLLLSSSPTYMNPSSAVNVSSSSFGVSENEIDEYDCESEEGIEALVEEQPAKPVPPRCSSKRSRAAEVHNLSEKRRRSRINEKMKALQNLIPNSNKTDKASMLDEAIEYLKQLQLQVQMLSMRNGLSLHPMCFSEGMQAQAALQLSQMRSEMDEENRSLPINMSTPTLPLPQENPLQYVSNSTLPNQRNARNQALVPSPSIIITPETSFGLEYPMLPHLRPFQLNRTCEIRGDDILQHQQLNANHSDTNPLGGSQEGQELFGNMHCRKRSVGSYPKK